MDLFAELSSSNSEDRNYPYHDYIKPPDKLGVSSKGNLSALTNDIHALEDYVAVLENGKSKAQTVSPMGNKYFMSTGATCDAPDGSQQPRYVYINNVPDGNIPFLSSATGTNFTKAEGLVPGVLEDIAYVNPLKLFSAFTTSTKCQEITMDTRDIHNATGEESRYVLESDISDYSPCWFQDKVNPVTNKKCVEAMTVAPASKDPIVRVYFAGVTALGMYIVLKLMTKHCV